MVLIAFDEDRIVSTRTFGEGEVRVFGRAGMDPEQWDFDEPATRVVGSTELPTPETTRLRIEVQFRDGRKVRVSVQLTS